MSTMPMNVLVCGMHYAPEHTGNAPYTTGLAEHLARLGHSVEVVTGIPHYPDWRVPPEYRWHFRSTERLNGVTCRRLRHYVPSSQSALTRAWLESTFALQVATTVPRRRPDVVLVVTPSLLSGHAARLIAARYGAPLVVWMQDSVAEAAGQSGIQGGGSLRALLSRLERGLLRSADHLVAISPHFADLGRQACLSEDRVHLVRNWTHVQAPTSTRDVTRAQLGWADDEIVALHTGNMGLKQNLENVVDAARPLDGRRVRFVLMGGGNQEEHLMALAADVPAADVLPPVPSEAYPNVLAAADCLVVNERPGILEMSLPSKLTSYLRSGRPVVAAVEKSGSTAREVEHSGAGVVVSPGDPRALRDAVLFIASNPGVATKMGARGPAYCDRELSGDASLGRLEDILRVAITAGGARSRRTRQVAVEPRSALNA